MLISLIAGTACSLLAATPRFIDATEPAGLGGINAARVKFVDLNGDNRADIVLTDTSPKHRVFLRSSEDQPKFVELATPNLPPAATGDCIVCADLDGDSIPDAILTRSLDLNNPKFVLPPSPEGSCWMKGNGDGTFGPPTLLSAATRGTTSTIAVGDVNRDGHLDLLLGLWYKNYGKSNEAYCNDLLISDGKNPPTFTRITMPSDRETFNEDTDLAGRPTYGLMILPRLEPVTTFPALFELSYGRRWNRLWVQNSSHDWTDLAPALKLDGDDIRHGAYPPEARRETELPYRSNGNTFDAAVADVNHDGRLDLFVSEITHWWAGEASDRSRFLINRDTYFESPASMNVDRIPKDPATRWNQGDIFCELADVDDDGRIDLLLSSGEYPDKQQLRIYQQQADGSFKDSTATSGIDHEGSAQIALADVDSDGDLDILAGQTFNRLTAEQTKGRSPQVKLFLNQSHQDGGKSVVLRLRDDRAGNLAGLGAVVAATSTIAGKLVTQTHVLTGIGGCGGKQHDFIAHFGLGNSSAFDQITITWPDGAIQKLENISAGNHLINFKK